MSSSALQNSWLNSYSTGGGTPGTGTFTNVNGDGATIKSSNPAGPTTIISADNTGLLESIGTSTATIHGACVVSATNNGSGPVGLSVVANATSTSAGTLAFNFNSGVGPGNNVSSLTATGVTNPGTGDLTLACNKMTFSGAGGTNATITMTMNDDFAVADLSVSGEGITPAGSALAMSGAVAVETGAGISFVGSTASTNGAGGKLVISATGGGGAFVKGVGTIPSTGTPQATINLPAGTTTSATSVVMVGWMPDAGATPVQTLPAGITIAGFENNWAGALTSFVVKASANPTAETQFSWVFFP